jgi:hypothetical protein
MCAKERPVYWTQERCCLCCGTLFVPRDSAHVTCGNYQCDSTYLNVIFGRARMASCLGVHLTRKVLLIYKCMVCNDVIMLGLRSSGRAPMYCSSYTCRAVLNKVHGHKQYLKQRDKESYKERRSRSNHKQVLRLRQKKQHAVLAALLGEQDLPEEYSAIKTRERTCRMCGNKFKVQITNRSGRTWYCPSDLSNCREIANQRRKETMRKCSHDWYRKNRDKILQEQKNKPRTEEERQRHNAASVRWQERNPERVKEYAKKRKRRRWHELSEEEKQYHRDAVLRSAKKHAARTRARLKAWKKENQEHVREKQKEYSHKWRAQNPELSRTCSRLAQRRRRAKQS